MTALPTTPISSVPLAEAIRPPAAATRRGLAGLAAGLRAVFVPGAAAALVTPALPARVVQERLVALGHLPAGAVTGRYDRPTTDAVARFQASALLTVDGVAGRATADRLLSSPELLASSSNARG